MFGEGERIKDPVIEAYKKDVDRTLIRENLKLTQEERLERLALMKEAYDEIQAERKSGRNTLKS
jgi:hypothetical protein